MIQIFGTNKNFDVKNAQRWFSDRKIAFSFIDLKEKTMSKGEFESVINAIKKQCGSRSLAIEELIDKNAKEYTSIAYLDDSQIEEKLFENQLKLLKLPICRNGKTDATVGINPKIWETWKN